MGTACPRREHACGNALSDLPGSPRRSNVSLSDIQDSTGEAVGHQTASQLPHPPRRSRTIIRRQVVTAGICAAHGKPLSFATFLRYGVPLTLCQLAVSALYVLVLFYLVGR